MRIFKNISIVIFLYRSPPLKQAGQLKRIRHFLRLYSPAGLAGNYGNNKFIKFKMSSTTKVWVGLNQPFPPSSTTLFSTSAINLFKHSIEHLYCLKCKLPAIFQIKYIQIKRKPTNFNKCVINF